MISNKEVQVNEKWRAQVLLQDRRLSMNQFPEIRV